MPQHLSREGVLCRLQHLTMGGGTVSEHQLYQSGVLLGELQEWVLQDAQLGVNMGSFSGVWHLHPSTSHILIDFCSDLGAHWRCPHHYSSPQWGTTMLAPLHEFENAYAGQGSPTHFFLFVDLHAGHGPA